MPFRHVWNMNLQITPKMCTILALLLIILTLIHKKKVGESSAQVTKETTITTLDEATYKVWDYLCCFSNPRNNFSVNWKIDWIYS